MVGKARSECVYCILSRPCISSFEELFQQEQTYSNILVKDMSLRTNNQSPAYGEAETSRGDRQ